MNHEARMKMYHKLLENKNYRKLKKLEDLKQFLDANEYDYIKNNINKYSSTTTRSIAIKVYRTLFKIEKLECPVCGYKVKTDGFHRHMISCTKCEHKMPVNLIWSSRNEELDFAKFLDKCRLFIKKYYLIANDKIEGFFSFKNLYNHYYLTFHEYKIYRLYYKTVRFEFIDSIVNGTPICETCYKYVGYKQSRTSDAKLTRKTYCSIKCREADETYVNERTRKLKKAFEENKTEIIKKRNETNLKVYGHICPLHSEYGKEKAKETSLKNWGAEHYMKSKKGIEKFKVAVFDKHGCWTTQLDSMKQKSVETQYEKYGDLYVRTGEFKEKAKETSIKNWGTEYPAQNPIIQEKAKETSIKNWGTEYPMQNPVIQMKIKENRYQGDLIPGTKEYNLEVYGTENPEEDLGVKHIDQYYNKEFIESKFTLDGSTFDFQDFLKYFNITEMTGYTHKKKLGIEIPNRYTTQGAIVDFIKELGFEVLENDRKAIAPMELDIYIPEKNLAIEYHGLMFHSIGKSKYSMFNNHGTERADYLRKLCAIKANLCDQKGIKLLQIFENEWLEHEETWKSIIKKELGICETVSIEHTIYLNINSIQAQEFLESNWIYDINYTSSHALLYAGNIVAVMLTDQNGYTRIIEHRDYRLLNLDKILKGKKVLVDRRLGGFVDLDHCATSKEHLEPKCYGFNENNLILQETTDPQFAIDQGNRVIRDAGYIVLEF